MQFKFPKDNEKYKWTDHVKGKMVYYGISESLIKRIVRYPARTEGGVAPDTMAVMQKATSKKPQEIWVMFQGLTKRQETSDKSNEKQKNQNLSNSMNSSPLALVPSPIRIISAWRYPGISKPGSKIPIPEDVAAELDLL